MYLLPNITLEIKSFLIRFAHYLKKLCIAKIHGIRHVHFFAPSKFDYLVLLPFLNYLNY